MANIAFLFLLLRLSAVVFGQDASSAAASSISSASAAASSAASTASQVSVTASAASSSASAALSSASSLTSASDTAAASSALSSASSLSAVASSASSAASSLSSIASSASSVVSSISSATLSLATTSTPLASSSDTTTATAESSSSSIATLSSSPSSAPTSSSSANTVGSSSTEETSSASQVVLTSTSSSISFASSTFTTTSVLPTTSANGIIGYTTLVTLVVQSSPASTYVNVSPYTTSQVPAAAGSASTQPGGSSSGGGGLSTGAKAGIGAGVGVAVLAAAIFGGWYSWYMRRRRRRSISASDRYPPSSIPSMVGMGGYGAVGAGAMTEKSDNRSELPSPPIGGPLGNSPTARSPDRLMPPGVGIASINSVSNQHSSQSISDYSGNEGRAPGSDAGDKPEKGYFPPVATGIPVHEMGDNERSRSPPQGYTHQRTFSGSSVSQQSSAPHPEHSQMPPSAGHERSLSGSSHQYQSPQQGQDGYWHDIQPHPSELQGSPGLPQGQMGMSQSPPREPYRGVDPEVPLHQRMETERVPVRPGHLQKQLPPGGGGFGPSHNF